MQQVIAGFDWDTGNLEKCCKHGVSIDEIETILSNDPVIAPDIKHSMREDRLIAIGRNSEGRPVFIAFTIRTRNGLHYFRPVSVRFMRAKEAERYEKKSP